MRHGGSNVTETPLPKNQPRVGRRPRGVEPSFCEPAARRGGPGAPDSWGSAPPARPAFADHLGLGGAPTIFWGSREPGAGCPCPTGMAPLP
jgi:hypothetical protein